MNMARARCLAVSILVLSVVSACRTPAYLTDLARRHALAADDPAMFEIKTAVYRHLFGLGFWRQREYSATFLQGSDAEVEKFMRVFPEQRPKIKRSSLAELRPYSTPIDRETGQPAVILSATGASIEGAVAGAVGSANALVRLLVTWYQSPLCPKLRPDTFTCFEYFELV